MEKVKLRLCYKTMLEYFGSIITFLAAIVAIRGETWNTNRKGWKKVTLTGYLTAIIALVGLLSSIYLTSKSIEEERELRERISQVPRLLTTSSEKFTRNWMSFSVPSGAIIEFYKLDSCSLEARASNRIFLLDTREGRIPVVGPPDRNVEVQIRSNTDQCEVKVFVTGT